MEINFILFYFIRYVMKRYDEICLGKILLVLLVLIKFYDLFWVV